MRTLALVEALGALAAAVALHHQEPPDVLYRALLDVQEAGFTKADLRQFVESLRNPSHPQLEETALAALDMIDGYTSPEYAMRWDQRECGGCRGLGAHSPHCHTQPGWRWQRLMDQAKQLGDEIGPNDKGAANAAWWIEEARDDA